MRFRGVVTVAAVLVLSSESSGEDDSYRKVVLELSGGRLQPRGAMREWRGLDDLPLFSPSGWGGVAFGFRVARYLQIDVGVDISPGVLGPRDARQDFNRLRELRTDDRGVGDEMLLAPFGLRIVLPIGGERLLIGLGGGGVYLGHVEPNVKTDRPPPLDETCGECRTRHGLGAYGLARAEYLLGAQRRFGLGAVVKFVRVRAHGDFLPRFGDSDVSDQWLQAGGTVTLWF